MYPYIQLGPLTVSTYYLVISMATTVAALWFLKLAADLNLAPITAIDITLVTLIGGFVGARLLHVFFEEPAYYAAQPWRVFAIWYGGFVYLGGMLGATFAAWIFCLWQKQPFFLWADVAAIPCAFGYALGRLACLLNGCCYGRHCELPWSVFMAGDHRHPAQAYATLWELGAVGVLWIVQRRLRSAGSLFAIWLIFHGVGRLMMESFRDDPRGEMINGLSLGTWMSFGVLICGGGLLWTRPPQSGPPIAIEVESMVE